MKLQKIIAYVELNRQGVQSMKRLLITIAKTQQSHSKDETRTVKYALYIYLKTR